MALEGQAQLEDAEAIRPMARIREKMSSLRFSTIWRGSSAAKAGTIMTAMDRTRREPRKNCVKENKRHPFSQESEQERNLIERM